MLPFEVFHSPAPLPAKPAAGEGRLPFYVEPLPEEGLFSWLHRLAGRLQTPFHALALRSFGVDDRAGHSQWWVRPDPWLLTRLSRQSGVAIPTLRRMTFLKWEPAFREDEENERFCYNRYTTQPPDHRAYRFVACGSCLREDKEDYLRRQWLLGWVAVCPLHDSVMIDRCTDCHAKLRVGLFSTEAQLTLRRCTRCDADLLDRTHLIADAAVVSLQARLLEAKQNGSAVFEGIGRLNWREVVSLIDILHGTIFRALTLAEQQEIQWVYRGDTDRWGADHHTAYSSRYGSLRLLAWLMSGWPDSDGSKVARGLITRWTGSTRNWISFHLASNPDEPQFQIPPEIKERLVQMAGSGTL